MKRVWWDKNVQCYHWDDGPGSVLRSDTSGLFAGDYRGEDWRDVESAEFRDGRFFIKVKEPPKVPTFAEEMEHYFMSAWPHHWNGQFRSEPETVRAIAAVKRELANPAKPSKYGECLIDEFLEIGANASNSLYYLMERTPEKCDGTNGFRCCQILKELQQQRRSGES